jgi:hypothetical protein
MFAINCLYKLISKVLITRRVSKALNRFISVGGFFICQLFQLAYHEHMFYNHKNKHMFCNEVGIWGGQFCTLILTIIMPV